MSVNGPQTISPDAIILPLNAGTLSAGVNSPGGIGFTAAGATVTQQIFALSTAAPSPLSALVDIVLVIGSGARARVLPAATSIEGRIIELKDALGNASGGTITVSVTGGGTIDGAATSTITADYGFKRFLAYNGNWLTI